MYTVILSLEYLVKPFPLSLLSNLHSLFTMSALKYLWGLVVTCSLLQTHYNGAWSMNPTEKELYRLVDITCESRFLVPAKVLLYS